MNHGYTYNIQDNNINNINTRYKEENEMCQVNYGNEYNVFLVKFPDFLE